MCIVQGRLTPLVYSPFVPVDTIVGVNKHALEKEEEIEVLSIDNSKVIQIQVRKGQW